MNRKCWDINKSFSDLSHPTAVENSTTKGKNLQEQP